MIPDIFKTAFRILKIKKAYFFINILGLAIGMASTIFIILWVEDELSYEKMHDNADRIYMLNKKYKMGDRFEINNALPYPLAATIEDEHPEISSAVRIQHRSGVFFNGEEYFTENSVCATDQAYFDLFSFEFLRGDPDNVLDDPNSIVLTESYAKKFFGDKDPMGKVLVYNNEDQFVVKAVIKDIARNTYLDYDIIIPLVAIYKLSVYADVWYDHFLETFIMLEPGSDDSGLNEMLTGHIRKYMTQDSTIEVVVQPLTKLHLYNLEERSERIQYVYIFSLIGLLIIIIASINYTNISTSLSFKRSVEIGIKKVAGASRRQLMGQFMAESFQQTFAAFLLSMATIELVRPYFNQLSGKDINIPYLSPWFILIILGLLIITTLMSGFYPAVYLSSLKPVTTVKQRILSGKGQQLLRVVLVVLQFSISIALIITTLVIYSQMHYIMHKDLGFKKENVLYLRYRGDIRENYEAFREELVRYPDIINIARTSSLPASVWNIVRGVNWEGRTSTHTESFAFLSVDYDFLETMGMELEKGRNFSHDFASDSNAIIINQKAIEVLNYEEPLGKNFLFDSASGNSIIGVVYDFHSTPLRYETEPLLFNMWSDMYTYILIRISPGDPQQAINHIEDLWGKYNPQFPFDYNFLDERIDREYRNEIRMGNLSGTFSLLAILITCIGLLGISSHTTQQKSKEIGVRKVFGASLWSILFRFISIYLKWIVLSSLIAWPLAWIFIENWLKNFAYRVDVSILAFLIASGVSLVVSLLTVAYQSISAANRNPVDTLRYE